MNTLQTVTTAFELLLITAALWGIFNEKKLIRWERKLLRKIKRGIWR